MYTPVLAPCIAGLKSKTAIQDQNPGSSPRLGSAPVPQGIAIHLILSFFMLNPQPNCKNVCSFPCFCILPWHRVCAFASQTDQTIVVKSPSFETPPLRAESSVGKGRWPCSCWYLVSSRHACTFQSTHSPGDFPWFWGSIGAPMDNDWESKCMDHDC